MRYDTTLGKYDGKQRSGGPRATLCVSSQVLLKLSHVYMKVFYSIYDIIVMIFFRLDAKWAANSVQLGRWVLKAICPLERLWSNLFMQTGSPTLEMLFSW